jgi:outer membrane biosynthesis protein TonB
MIQARKKRNSSKVNLVFSLVFHTLIILAVVFFAAHEGILGKRMKQLTATLVPKEKPPEPPKQKPPEPKLETPKVAAVPKAALTPEPPKVETAAAPPVEATPAVAPAAVDIPTMQFDGGKEVQSVSDPNVFYKGLVETALRTRWNRPEDLDDQNFVADVQVSVDRSGEITGYNWVKGSGNQRWDDSVKNALAKTKSVGRTPPKTFPEKFLVRFDVESMRTEDAIQLSDVGHP